MRRARRANCGTANCSGSCATPRRFPPLPAAAAVVLPANAATTAAMNPHAPLGITVMPEWFQCEGIEPVLDRVQSIGATAFVTSPYVLEASSDGEGGREPPADGEAGRVRPLDRPLFGRTELWVRTAPSFAHDLSRYAGLRYQPSPPSPLTLRHADLLDRVFAAAAARGLAVYLQVRAASPPGYRVQFSAARPEDQCLGPDLQPHAARVDRNASLGSGEVVAYVAALAAELATRYPTVAGFRLDWPEYPPYDFRSALFDFNPAVTALMAEAGHDPVRVARDVASWANGLRRAVQGAGRNATAVGRSGADGRGAGSGPALDAALDAAGWSALAGDDGPLVPLFAAKRRAARALLLAVRGALDAVPGPRRLLEPQAFPPPFNRISGFPLGELEGVADRVGIKLYTMHWPMLARYWARDLLDGQAPEAALDAVTAAVALRFGLVDGQVDGATLHYPEPQQPHPAGRAAQLAKLRDAQATAGDVPVTAFVHSYGPLDDVVARFDIARQSGLACWINRYGYLSDAKVAALGAVRHG